MYVRPSLLPDAGLGLFANVKLESGVFVPGCTYGGEALTFMEARRRKNKEYLMALHFNVHIDASDDACLGYLGRYVNDADGGFRGDDGERTRRPPGSEESSSGLKNEKLENSKNNCVFVKDPENRLARLRTLRFVNTGEELTAAYGEQYWRHKRNEHESRYGTSRDDESRDESLKDSIFLKSSYLLK